MRTKCLLKNLILIPGFLFYQLTLFAQSPNYTGVWVLNQQKSKLESSPKGLVRSVFIIKQEGDKFVLTRYHILTSKKKKIKFSMIADGKTRRVKMLFKGKLERTESGLRATLWRKNFSNIVNYRFGDNPNEFIADEIFTGKPKNHHNIWVFDKEVFPENK